MKIKVGRFVYYFYNADLYCGTLSTVGKKYVTLKEVQKFNGYDGWDNSRDLVNKRIHIWEILVHPEEDE